MKCLIEKCKRQAHSRGVCNPHYQRVARLIATGNTTWYILMQAGQALAPHAKSKARL